MQKLTKEEVFEVVESLDQNIIDFERVRPRNKGEVRRRDSMNLADFKDIVAKSIDDSHQPGGDIELRIPTLGKTLVGHHDGIYWLE